MIADAAQSALRVFVAGLIFGAGLPALFAIGVRFWIIGSPDPSADGQVGRRSNPAALAVAIAAFAVIAVAVVVGVLWITQKSIAHYFGITVF